MDRVAGTCTKCGGWRGQLGNEPMPELYIKHIVSICREIRRALRSDGVFWLNIGDSWCGATSQHHGGVSQGFNSVIAKGTYGAVPDTGRKERTVSMVQAGIKPLDMVLIPEQLALALRADGWYLRSILIWNKTNPMPESVSGWRWEKHKIKISKSARADTDSYHALAYGDTPMGARDSREFADHSKEWQDCPGCPKCTPNDGLVLRKGSWRPTDSFEQIFMLTKTGSYFCDRESVLEPIAPSTIGRGRVEFGGAKGREYNPDENDPNFRNGSERWGRTYDYTQSNSNGGRNLRSVLTVPTHPFRGAHFATYPPNLITPLIKAATSEKGCCPKCGSPWARVIEKPEVPHDGETDCKNTDGQGNTRRLALLRQAARERGEEYSSKSSTIGWRPTCSCGLSEVSPCRVLDSFSGAGTTALVCERLNLDSINIDTSTEYIQLAKDRLEEDEQKRMDEFIRKAKADANKEQK